jgi:hypothetical protein
MTQTPITRRQVLAGLGAVGLVAAGPRLVRAARGDPEFTQYTLAQSADGGPDLRIAWYETYNGVYQEDSNRFTSGPALQPTNESFNHSAEADRFVDTVNAMNPGETVEPGAVIGLDNVLPGDEGVVVIGLLAEDADARVWFKLDLLETPENGRYEPELAAGDATDGADEGELQDAIDVELWYDNGLTSGCDGVKSGSEEFVSGLSTLGSLDGTLAQVAADTDQGVELDFDLLGLGCLPAGDERCVAFRWSFPPAADNNRVQTDGVSFLLRFATVACSNTDAGPFAGGPSAEAER